MTGMIAAGADSLQAVRLQVVVAFMLLAAVSLTGVQRDGGRDLHSTLVSLRARRLFTPGGRCDGWSNRADEQPWA